MTSWMLIFAAYLVPAVIVLPLLLLWNSLASRRRLTLCRSSTRGNAARRMRRLCVDTLNGGQS